MSELPPEILQKIPEPIFDAASGLESSLARIAAIIQDLTTLFKGARRDKTSMDPQELSGVVMVFNGLESRLTGARRNLSILLKRIAEATDAQGKEEK